MESKTYKIDRKSNSLDIVNLEYSNIDGYKIKPKVNKENTKNILNDLLKRSPNNYDFFYRHRSHNGHFDH